MTADPDLDEQTFGEEERRYIGRQLNEIKQYISTTLRVQLEERKFVEDRFQYFEESTNRLGRKDWPNLFVGGLLSIVVMLSLPSSSAGELVRMASAAFHAFVNTLPRIP